jgi:ABC-2 type transport system permease protein
MEKKIDRRKGDLRRYFFIVLMLIQFNFISTIFFFRLDLTEEKRYSITEPTRQLLRNLDDVVTVEVYLEGEMPSGFKRFQQSIRETLEEFRIYAGDNIQYQFTDPGEGLSGQNLNNAYLALAEKGLTPTNLTINEGDQRTDKIIFPGALVNYKGRDLAVLFLKGNFSAPPEVRINQSIEGLEFEIAKAIKKLSTTEKKKIAVTYSNGELPESRLASITSALKESYDVERLNLYEKVHIKGYDAVIVAGPDSALTEAAKYKLDQFVVKGGRALFLMDMVSINIDSIGEQGTYAFAKNLKSDELFYAMGVRFNPDLIQDLYCSAIPLFVGYEGDKPVTKMVPWKFYPLINNHANHPITRNLDAIYSRFIGSIDTVKASGITKTPLLFSSRNSRILPAPVRVNFSEIKIPVDPKMYDKGPFAVAYLLEGKFQSSFTGRLSPEATKELEFLSEDKASKVIVVSDADVIANDVSRQGQAKPLGYDRFTNATFANRDFLLNAMDYLLDDTGVILSRNRQVTFRPLDKVKVKDHQTLLQIINVGLPVLLLLIYGGLRYRMRKKKYELL